ncbi:MAG: diguanylate cyclase [Smithella sp.]
MKLYNSRYFHAQLKREIERSKRYEQPLTLLLLDLDKLRSLTTQTKPNNSANFIL